MLLRASDLEFNLFAQGLNFLFMTYFILLAVFQGTSFSFVTWTHYELAVSFIVVFVNVPC